MDNPLITVIVTAYCVESYLPRCIRSIQCQTYRNLEVIIVDDGSPDRCGEIADIYSREDDRIRVIHKENGGLADARNVALGEASGEYITFVDSDDFVNNDYVSTLYDILQESDSQISVTTLNPVNESDYTIKDTSRKNNVKIYSSDDAIISLFYQKGFDTSACGKLYAKSLFAEGIRFPKGYVYEDMATIYKLMIRCTRIAYLDYRSYNYLYRSGSIERSPFSKVKFDSCNQIVLQLEHYMSSTSSCIRNAVMCRIESLVFHVVLDIPMKEHFYTEQLYGIIKKYRRNVIIDHRARRKTRIACLLSYLGIGLLKGIFSLRGAL